MMSIFQSVAKMNFFKLSLFLAGFLITSSASARHGATLPGGMLFPAFATASLTNPAALANDWRKEIQVLYSPPLQPNEPHSYLASGAAGSGRLGMNLGYSGSSQEGVAFHNVFAGVAARIKRLSVGLGTRIMGIGSNIETALDAAGIFQLTRRIHLGGVLYDSLGTRQLGMGIGWLSHDRFSLQVDLLVPFDFNQHLVSSEYAVTAAGVWYFYRFGFSLGTRYNQISSLGRDEKSISLNVGTFVRLAPNWSVIAFYNSAPTSVSVGLGWNLAPSSQQLIEFFQDKSQKQIEQK